MPKVSRLLEAETPLGEHLELLRMTGREEFGRLSVFQLEFVSGRSDIKPQEILGKKIAWSLELADAEVRWFNGYVTRFAEAGAAAKSHSEEAGKGQAYYYQATVHPCLWFLTRRSNCRTFQNKTVIEIVEEVIQYYEFATLKKAQLRSDYPKKEFVVQYRETDFNFVCRLLEQEGIYFAIEYGDDGEHACVLMDSYGAHKALAPLQVPFYPEGVPLEDKDCMTAWSVQFEIQSGRYVHDDYDWKTPHVKVSGEGLPAIEKPNDLGGYEIYDYPGEYKPGEGEQYAKVRIEELHTRYEQFSGSGCVRLCAPGRRLKLQDHPRRTYNESEYLLTSVSYSASVGDYASGGTGAEFHCEVTAIDSKATFRPQRLTPKPVVQGPQTAFVVGPAGEEIYTDEYGRIKVQFHWDRYSKTNENSSCWIRVAQPFAGKEWGFTGYPRVGHEVVVYFLEGDPDYPLVCGSLYNGDAKPPYKPDLKTRTGYKSKTYKGSGWNELYFEDKPGYEEIYMYAQLNKSVYVNNNRYTYVGYDDHLVVKYDQYEKCEGDHHVMLTGNRNEKLDGCLSLDVGGDLDQKVGMKLACDAGMEIHLKAGMTMVLEAQTSLTLKVGSNYININPAGVFITGTMVMINSGGAAGSGSGASPEAPKEAKPAHGSYGGSGTAPPKKYQPGPYRYKPSAWKPQARMFQMAAESGTPFCEICNC